MKEELFILWTNDNPVTSEKMVCMYAHNSVLKHWWDDVTVIIWGATAQYVASDADIQKRLSQMIKDGVKVSACKACADQLGVGSDLENLGIELKYWGIPLTGILKNNQKLITI
ncbi:MAG: DsrE family protein [Spirochaetales bacterium]|nr:DsrE family protein [Spirochaetales bacterium]